MDLFGYGYTKTAHAKQIIQKEENLANKWVQGLIVDGFNISSSLGGAIWSQDPEFSVSVFHKGMDLEHQNLSNHRGGIVICFRLIVKIIKKPPKFLPAKAPEKGPF